MKTHIVTTWIQTHKSVPIYGPPTHHTVEVVVTTRTSPPNVLKRCFERLVSVSSQSPHHMSHLQPCFE